ncbi:hypothetical protein [Pedobacter miscanthi]|jgi:hypothetical protein|uniref:hypothetical protein n=1 Tax=Pedobacter miscanthi TaxID=2259170 RepID=UPI0029314502|nr:hypothetical protein [Pedobacter miscanthi]
MRITGFNIILTILLLLLISSAGFAQRMLNGMVASKKDGQAIPGAAAFLTKTGDSAILRTAITDNDGKFSVFIYTTNKISGNASKLSLGIGLENLSERLQKAYGERAKLSWTKTDLSSLKLDIDNAEQRYGLG